MPDIFHFDAPWTQIRGQNLYTILRKMKYYDSGTYLSDTKHFMFSYILNHCRTPSFF